MPLLEIDVILLEAVALADTSSSWLSPGVAFRVVSMPLTLHGRPGVSGRGVELRGVDFGVEGPTWDSPQRHRKHTEFLPKTAIFSQYGTFNNGHKKPVTSLFLARYG